MSESKAQATQSSGSNAPETTSVETGVARALAATFVAVVAYLTSYLLPVAPVYLPIEREWVWSVPEGAISMRYYGILAYGVLGWGVGWVVCSRVSEKAIRGISVALTAALVALITVVLLTEFAKLLG